MPRRRRFTLAELVTVVFILGILATVVDPYNLEAKSNGCKTNIETINSQIELYYANTGRWPTTLDAVTGNTSYFPDGAPTCPVTGAAYPNIRVNNRVDPSGHAH